MTKSAALRGTLRRSVPLGRARKLLVPAMACSRSDIAAEAWAKRNSPAAVRGDAAVRPVEQPHAQACLKSTHRVAERRGAHAPFECGLAEARCRATCTNT